MQPKAINGQTVPMYDTPVNFLRKRVIPEIRACGQPDCEYIAESLASHLNKPDFVGVSRILQRFSQVWMEAAEKSVRDWKPTSDDTGNLFQSARDLADLAEAMGVLATRFLIL